MQLLIEQKITALVNQYRIYATDGNGNKTQLQAFAQQKRFAFKEAIEFYSDETKSNAIFRMQADKVMDYHGQLTVFDQQEQALGALKKHFKSSLLRSTWQIMQNDTPKIIVQERNKTIAYLRRIWDFIPYANDIPFPFKFHFDFVDVETQQVVGSYDKLTYIRDHYLLTVDDAVAQAMHWQTFAALGVALDALQGR